MLSDDALETRLRAAGCVFAEDEAAILREAAGDDDALLDALAARRVAGEPLEHVVGWVAFDGLRVAVRPGVFVPRRRTELLVRVVEELLAARSGSASRHRAPRTAPGTAPTLVELCCGVAPVATALAARHPALSGHAADVDPAAVACARLNLPADRVHLGDLFDALPATLRGSVDVVVANAPYVPTDAIPLMPPEAREHEAHMALDGGVDGLDVQRRIAAAAPAWLAPGGSLVVETSERQAAGSEAALRAHGFTTRVVRDEDLDATAVVGVLRVPGAAER